ncbi:hypothetical protein S40288_08005 [Stachybotrys chartarum IBT 40288]|nr:hypothetical protein S40288_08005 [Stachybotrys chartarum IBT 40288]
MDRASQVLAQGVPPGVPRSYRALADHGNVPHSTLHHRARGRPSIEEKARGQQYLKPYEEDVVVQYLLQMSDLGQPIRMKFVPSIAFRVTRHRPASDRPLKPPGRNWTKALEKRHPELIARRVKALDWNRHEKNIYKKITHWFEVIQNVLQDPAVLAKNVYNMDETGVMLSMSGSVKVLNRRSAKSLVLGKAKVMSYKDLEDAQAKRVGKEFTKAAKGKGKRGQKSKSSLPKPEEGTAETARRGRKRKSAELEVPEPTNKMAQLSNAPKPASALVMQPGTQVAEEIEPRPWRAPVAPM